MKWKHIIVSCLMFAGGLLPADASGPGTKRQERDYPLFTFGMETSYVLGFMNYSHFNFISADGDRRDERSLTAGAVSNGQILAGCGINLSRNWNLSLFTGYGGVYRRERMVPLSLRVTWLSGDNPLENRWLLFCGAGIGFNDFERPEKVSAEGKIGAGYRISLNRAVKLDFLVGFQEVYTHPRAGESDTGDYVAPERMRRNDAFLSALTIGLALVF